MTAIKVLSRGSTYADRPWDLNGYAIRLDGCTVLVDPPSPGEDDWPSFDLIKPIAKIVLTNRDHIRDAELFRTRCAARLVAGADEVTQLAPIAIDEAVREGDLIAGALRVIHLPGKSAGEIGLYFDPAHHAVSREMGGILPYPRTGVSPGLKVMVDRATRWKFAWQQSPLAACP